MGRVAGGPPVQGDCNPGTPRSGYTRGSVGGDKADPGCLGGHLSPLGVSSPELWGKPCLWVGRWGGRRRASPHAAIGRMRSVGVLQGRRGDWHGIPPQPLAGQSPLGLLESLLTEHGSAFLCAKIRQNKYRPGGRGWICLGRSSSEAASGGEEPRRPGPWLGGCLRDVARAAEGRWGPGWGLA